MLDNILLFSGEIRRQVRRFEGGTYRWAETEILHQFQRQARCFFACCAAPIL
jgi:hypothetical protein